MPEAPAVAAGTPANTSLPTAPKPPTPAAPKPAAPEAAASPEPLYDIVVSGQKKKVPLQELIRRAQKGDFSEQLTRQASDAIKATKKREEEIAAREALWEDDDKLSAELEKRGKLDAITRRRLEQKLAEQGLTPEQREAQQHQARADAAEGKLKDNETQQQTKAREERYRMVSQQTETELMSATERLKFERTPESFGALHSVFAEWVELGLLGEEPATPWQAEQMVQAAAEKLDGARSELQSKILAAKDGAGLYELLGKEGREKLNQYQLALLRGTVAKPAEAAPQQPKPAQAQSKYITPDEARAKLRMLGR